MTQHKTEENKEVTETGSSQVVSTSLSNDSEIANGSQDNVDMVASESKDTAPTQSSINTDDAGAHAEQQTNPEAQTIETQTTAAENSDQTQSQSPAETQNQTQSETQTGNGTATATAEPDGDQLPGYQEACVIAANNLRELDMKALMLRLQRRFAVNGMAQTASTALLVLLELLEITIMQSKGCFEAGAWAGGLLLLTGIISVAFGKARRFRDNIVRRLVMIEVIGLICTFIAIILFIRHWMESTTQSNLYAAFQVMHIAKLAIGVFVFVMVTSKIYIFYRYEYCCRSLNSSSNGASLSGVTIAGGLANPTARDAEHMRNASLTTIFEVLERRPSINDDDDDDVVRYVEPPPDYENVVTAPSTGPAAQTQATEEPARSE